MTWLKAQLGPVFNCSVPQILASLTSQQKRILSLISLQLKVRGHLMSCMGGGGRGRDEGVEMPSLHLQLLEHGVACPLLTQERQFFLNASKVNVGGWKACDSLASKEEGLEAGFS